MDDDLPFPSNHESDEEHEIDEDEAEMAYLDREEAMATGN